MKIYAIRDRLIDYFMQPFVGPDDKNVQSAVARTINQGEVTSDIAQAPHHFEIWSLADITEDGHIQENRYLVQDCAALVRPGLRNTGISQRHTAEDHPGEDRSRNSGHDPNRRAEARPLPRAPQSPSEATGEVRHGAQGGYPPRDD